MYKVLITGSTGMVGKGVLLECLDNAAIASVTVLNRTSIQIQHPKLRELLLTDFMEVDQIKDALGPFDGCFHCMGVSAVGLNESQYNQITYEVTKRLADTLHDLNPDMVFNYVSGAGTDTTEKGRSMWARIKGKTENYILGKGFQKAYMFRPVVIIPEKGIKSRTGWYNTIYVVMRPFFPLMKKSKNVTTTTNIGKAMIHSLSPGFDHIHLENKDINVLAKMADTTMT
ncbi:MAG: NAD-dependent epimerase/dehydratase family protein [Flavobacteriaceae bacterium]